MKEIKIEDFIKIKILDLNSEDCVYFVEKYNEKYFYTKEDNRLCTHQITCGNYRFYFQKANIIHRSNLNGLEQDVYKLYKKLTFSLPRAEKDTKYYIISRNFNVVSATELNDITDNNQYRAYNYFLSEEEATQCAQKLQQYLIELRKEEAMKENK